MLERASSALQSSDRLPAGRQGLAERRRTRRRRTRIAYVILLLIIIGSAIYGLQQEAVRVSDIYVFGTDTSLSSYATRAMQGWYLGIIPRDSIFFVPVSRIRADILADHPDIAALSVFRSGFTSISIKTTDRAPIARWCGLAPTVGVDEYCYVFDASGVLYAASSIEGASSTPTINSFRLYAPLEGNTLEPLRATLAHAKLLPGVFDLARQLTNFGTSVTSIVINANEEVTDYLTSGTYITYVLGHEQNAFTALVSAKDNFNLADGSIEYIDLRFDGKVYLKKKQ